MVKKDFRVEETLWGSVAARALRENCDESTIIRRSLKVYCGDLNHRQWRLLPENLTAMVEEHCRKERISPERFLIEAIADHARKESRRRELSLLLKLQMQLFTLVYSVLKRIADPKVLEEGMARMEAETDERAEEKLKSLEL